MYRQINSRSTPQPLGVPFRRVLFAQISPVASSPTNRRMGYSEREALRSSSMSAESSNSQSLHTTCCIVGGGPAGMVLGFLLARAGVDVQVLEKHADFLRDFRGDTIHPSTFELMYELGLLDDFLRRPHQQLTEIGAAIENTTVTVADFSHL